MTNAQKNEASASKTIENLIKLTSHIVKAEALPRKQAEEIAEMSLMHMGYKGAMHPTFGYVSIMKARGWA